LSRGTQIGVAGQTRESEATKNKPKQNITVCSLV
jgi:hypothetical protein